MQTSKDKTALSIRSDASATLGEQYDAHPAADLFPMMTAEELEALGADMLKHGQREEIVLFKGQILDGRNRYRACLAKGINPRFREERPADPLAFVASTNLHRRHLDASQRAMIADSLAKLRDGERKGGASQDAATQAEAAKLLDVGRTSVQRARFVREHGVPNLTEAVKKGEVPVKRAAEFAKTTPPVDQIRLIAEHGSVAAAVKAAVKTQADRAETRARMSRKAKCSNRKMEPPARAPERSSITEVDDTAEVWASSVRVLAGDAIAATASWTRSFGDWRKFSPPSDILTLARQARDAWTEIEKDLLGRFAALPH